MSEAISDVRHLFEVGGTVLSGIGMVALLLWTLLLERLWFFARVHPPRADAVAQAWDARVDKQSWEAHVIRRLWISQLTMALNDWLGLIRALVTVCPLLGLLGTTTGMVEVYEVMAIEGSGDPKAMADGVSQAMVTTMAGLVIALSGIFLSARLENSLSAERDRLASRLHIDQDLLGNHHRVRSHKAKQRSRLQEEERRGETPSAESMSIAARARAS